MVLGHATLKNEEVDQTEWWAAKQALVSDSKVIVQSSQGRRKPKGVATGVSKSRCFYGLADRLGQSDEPSHCLSSSQGFVTWEGREDSFHIRVKSF